MRLCIFIASIDKNDGGPSRSVPILAKGLAENGHEVVLMSLETPEMNLHLLQGSPVEVMVLESGIDARSLEKAILDSRCDLIHCQGIWMPVYHRVCKIARKHNIPYMMAPRGALEPWCLHTKFLKKHLAFALYQKADLQKAGCILATARQEADNLRRLGIKTPVAIIPNGIDISEYGCRSRIQDVKKQVLFLSRIHEKKGIEYLLEAWAMLKDRFPGWNLVIAGNGEQQYIDSLHAVIERQQLTGSVSILPPVFGEEKHRLYRESALFVLPSYSENFGMVIAEALSCGVPVITTKGTPWQLLDEERIGWCIDLDVENLAKTMDAAMSLPRDALYAMGQKGSAYVRKHLQYTSVAEKNAAVYGWISGSSPKPDFVR